MSDEDFFLRIRRQQGFRGVCRVVFDDDGPGHPAAHLDCRRAMGVGMIPVRSNRMRGGYFDLVGEFALRLDIDQHIVATAGGRNMHAMVMQIGGIERGRGGGQISALVFLFKLALEMIECSENYAILVSIFINSIEFISVFYKV